MKTSRLALVLTFFIAVLSFTNCRPDPEEEVVTQKFLVKSELLTTYTSESAKTILNGMALTGMATQIQYNIKLYKVTYKTSFEGDTIVASGTVAVPDVSDSKRSFPIMSFQHGTITAKSEAPSVGYNTSVSNQLINYIAGTGFIVAVPDYIGFGSTATKFHPFMQKQYTNNAVIDFIRATKEFIGIEKPVSTNGKIFMAGYSQGASATLGALSAIENELANADIKITAASCGSGAYDLNLMRKTVVNLSKYEQPYFMAYVLESFKTYEGLTTNYADIFNPAYAVKMPGIINGVKTGAEINADLSMVVEHMYTENFRLNYDTDPIYVTMKTILDKNSVKAWNNKTPIQLYHGLQDTWISGVQSTQLATEFSKLGSTTVQYKPIYGDHTIAAPLMIMETIAWFKQL